LNSKLYLANYKNTSKYNSTILHKLKSSNQVLILNTPKANKYTSNLNIETNMYFYFLKIYQLRIKYTNEIMSLSNYKI